MRKEAAVLGTTFLYPLTAFLILIPGITPSIRRAYEKRGDGRPNWAIYFFSQLLGLVVFFVSIFAMNGGAFPNFTSLSALSILAIAYGIGLVLAAVSLRVFWA